KDISLKLRVHPYVVYQTVRELRRWGFKIQSERKKGYRLVESPDLILPAEIKKNLKTKIFGKKIYSYRKVGSTNLLGFRLAETGSEEGTLIVAEEQTKGKGRMGRSWYSPPRLGLWMSLILRPPVPPFKAPGLSICAGLALAQTIKEMTGTEAKIKWPNDCLIDGKKVGGILLELSAELDRINFVIVGIGVNVNHSAKDFPRNLSQTATSMKIKLGKDISRLALLTSFLEEFERIYLDFKKKGLSAQREMIKSFSSLLGKKVAVRFGKEKIEGMAKNIDENGSLVIKTKKGEKVVRAGEVTVL
ncbi:MAG: biotin--[acetyl-CoA-carboxylase] ligase, partial [candidate division Zixibacteria bacterium]|nr:biotin--[acetyl-CoA-carboxylase] ligase [candidate division Zixibacteria bacterium]